jgi:hypothetical protein
MRKIRELVGDPDPVKSKRVMDAILQMDKIDLEALKRKREIDALPSPNRADFCLSVNDCG